MIDLPLNGRTFIGLAALAPGVALPPGSQLPRINGGRPRVNEYLYDGISVLQPEPGQVAYVPVIDAIQEFRVESNSPPAEFGRFNGGVINLSTKAGSNRYRGTRFEFLRHEALNARHVFAPGDATAPRFRRNQFGGVLGGPMRRDRTFFFADYQGQRQTIGRTPISTVPTLLQRQGVFTESVAGRVPVIYDPRTTTGVVATRLPFPDHSIPVDRVDPGRARVARPVSAAHIRRDGQQLPARGRRDQPAGPVRPARRRTREQCRAGVRADLALWGGVHTRDTVAGWERRDHGDAGPARDTGSGAGLGVSPLGRRTALQRNAHG